MHDQPPGHVLEILVANSGSSGVSEFDLQTGGFLGRFIAADPTRLPFPDSILPGLPGELLVTAGCRTTEGKVCDQKLSSIERYDAVSGRFVGTFSTAADSPLYRPYGMAVGPDGLVYVASLMNNKILRYEPNGRFVDIFASGDGTDPVGLNGPNGLAFDDYGHLYVTTEGSLPADGMPTFPPEFRSVVRRYNLATGESTVFANPADQDGQPSLEGIRIGPCGRLFVSDFELNVVRLFDLPSGQEIVQLSTQLAGLNEQYTGEIIFGPAGELLVTIGSQKEPILGAVLRFSGDSYGTRVVLVPPTENLNRPGGIILR